MSAFIVSHAHIDALLTFADNKRMLNDLGYRIDRNKQFTWTEIGRVLLAENERSVCHRYPDLAGGDDMPGTIGQEAVNYKFRTWQPAFRMQHTQLCVTVIKACDCFDYQACETDDYEQSIAHQIIGSIRAKAVRCLPGYDDAPWGINDHTMPKAAV